MLENEVDRGFIEEFLSQLPEKAFHLGLRVVLAGLAFLVGVQLIRILRHVIKKALGRSRIEESAMRFIDSFIKFGLYFVLILMIASSLGVDAASILAILGSASVAIGLAVQGSLSNFAGGVLLLILKPFTAGDYIKDGLETKERWTRWIFSIRSLSRRTTGWWFCLTERWQTEP